MASVATDRGSFDNSSSTPTKHIVTELPLFALSSIVMPGGRLPLRIFEPRYLTMVKDCLKSNSGFGVCLISDGREVGPPARIYPYGTLIKIVDWDTDESGLLQIVTEGVQNFRTVSTENSKTGLLIGDVEMLPLEKKTPIPAEFQGLAELLQPALDSLGPLFDYTEADLTDAVWVGGRLVELLPMISEKRHEMISMDNPLDRLRALRDYVDDETNW